MNDVEIMEKVTTIIRGVLRRPRLQLTPQTRAPDVPRWDSFAMVLIIVEVQDEFTIELATSDLDEMDNVGDLVRAISASVPATSGEPCVDQ